MAHTLKEVLSVDGQPVRQPRKYAFGDGFEFIGSYQIVPDGADANSSVDASSLIADRFALIEDFDVKFHTEATSPLGLVGYDRATKRIRFFNSAGAGLPPSQVADGVGNLAAYLASISRDIVTVRIRGI